MCTTDLILYITKYMHMCIYNLAMYVHTLGKQTCGKMESDLKEHASEVC